MRAHPHDTAVCILRHLLSCSVWRVSTDSLWQSCFADGTRGLTAAACSPRAAAAASGEYAACLRLKRSFSAPHISHCMGQYARHSCLHMLPVYLRCQCCSAASVFTCESHGPRARALSAPVTVFTVRGTGTPSPSQLCARVRVSHGLSFRAALMPSSVAIYSLSPSRAGY